MPVLPIVSQSEYEAQTTQTNKLCVVEFKMSGCNASERMLSQLEQLDATYKGTICLYRARAGTVLTRAICA